MDVVLGEGEEKQVRCWPKSMRGESSIETEEGQSQRLIYPALGVESRSR